MQSYRLISRTSRRNSGDAYEEAKEDGSDEGKRKKRRKAEVTEEEGDAGGCMGIITQNRGKILNVRVLYVGKIP